MPSSPWKRPLVLMVKFTINLNDAMLYLARDPKNDDLVRPVSISNIEQNKHEPIAQNTLQNILSIYCIFYLHM